jgi:hypothetical protein
LSQFFIYPNVTNHEQGHKMTISALIKFATGSVPRVFGAPINSLRRLQISLAFLCVATAALGQEPVNPLKPLDLASPSGTGFAFPSQTLYLGRDTGLDPNRTEKAEEQVRQWSEEGCLPIKNSSPGQPPGTTIDPPPGLKTG